MNTVHCQGTKRSGELCGTTLGLSPAGLCISHDPERRDALRALRSAGGKRSAEARRERRDQLRANIPDDVPATPKTLEDATTYFAWLVNAGATGRLDARTVHECAFALKGFQSAAEKSDLERQVKQLRKLVSETAKCPACATKLEKIAGRR